MNNISRYIYLNVCLNLHSSSTSTFTGCSNLSEAEFRKMPKIIHIEFCTVYLMDGQTGEDGTGTKTE
jgi:hypothetical protein